MLLAAAPARAELRLLYGPLYPKTKVDYFYGAEPLAKPGKALGVRYLAEGDSILSLGFELAALRPELEHRRFFDLGEFWTGFESYLALAELRLARSEGLLRPFVLAGAGGHRTRLIFEMAPPPFYVWADTDTTEKRALIDSTRFGPAGTLQGGLDVFFNEQLSLGVAAVWYYLGETKYQPTAFGSRLLETQKSAISSTAVMATLGLRFY